jgi:2-polyprenyl-6-methoxyphenol hydroxylase-like FAD-dependent oxidoreductase
MVLMDTWRGRDATNGGPDVITSGNRADRSAPGAKHYNVVIAGARCAGASMAMLLARAGLRVLLVDPVPYGRDTLSTHALMRGAVLQLHRWGLLDSIVASGAPPIRTTTFHYGGETIEIPIKPSNGVDALYAPRRTVLDPVLVDAAREAGAEVLHGLSVVDLIRDDSGRVRGARIAGADQRVHDVSADLVVGADGIRSKVARLVDSPYDYVAHHAACSIYGYWPDTAVEGYHWYYERGFGAGMIPTNDGTCIFAGMPSARFEALRHEGTEALFRDVIGRFPESLRDVVGSDPSPAGLRAFPGRTGFLRRATGPGWVLVGDAGYFRDPITAHGITDALREAAIIARLIVDEGDSGLREYQVRRDALVEPLLSVTDRIASFDWDLDEVQSYHLDLNRQMKACAEFLMAIDTAGSPT